VCFGATQSRLPLQGMHFHFYCTNASSATRGLLYPEPLCFLSPGRDLFFHTGKTPNNGPYVEKLGFVVVNQKKRSPPLTVRCFFLFISPQC
jgi:hypothetical protein